MGMPVTVKGQVTIPKAIRDRLGISPGESEVEFELQPDGQVMLRKTESDPVADRFARLKGLRPEGWNGMTTEQIMRLTRGKEWGRKGRGDAG